MTLCDQCGRPADVTLTAAYLHDPTVTHPEWATYPMPMIRTCLIHLAEQIVADRNAEGATPGYLLRMVER